MHAYAAMYDFTTGSWHACLAAGSMLTDMLTAAHMPSHPFLWQAVWDMFWQRS